VSEPAGKLRCPYCDNRPSFWIVKPAAPGPWTPVCGIHLTSGVKLALRTSGSVTVREIP
jgi:pyruvate-formate lyase-activating enzyme